MEPQLPHVGINPNLNRMKVCPNFGTVPIEEAIFEKSNKFV